MKPSENRESTKLLKRIRVRTNATFRPSRYEEQYRLLLQVAKAINKKAGYMILVNKAWREMHE